MLGFFRKHQKYFFVAITVVIVISFSFFGTYSRIPQQDLVDPVVFTAVDGTEVKRSELEEMVTFLATDVEDKQWLGGAWGPNFLNDGVIKRDFLQGGLAGVIAEDYLEEMEGDLNSRFKKEKAFRPYENPQVQFISAANVWNYIVPEMNQYLKLYQMIGNPASKKAFDVRINLFLAQQKFPPYALRQALRYQEQQFNWVKPDPALRSEDLSLFGYHKVEDWFGPNFVRLIAEFIYNSAIVAEEKGYEVSSEEAYAELIRSSEKSFRANLNNPGLGVANSSEYINEQLRRMGMDLSTAVGVWQRVLLFRRLFNDVESSVFVDPFSINKIQGYSNATVKGELYQLPEEMMFRDFKTLQKFEVYLDAIAQKREDVLSLPTQFVKGDKLKDTYPELVQKRYLVKMAEVDKNFLQEKVSLKDTWNWEVEDQNWEILKNEFPELGVKKGKTRDERFTSLDSLDANTRARVDAFARKEIVAAHPEWLKDELDKTALEAGVISFRQKGGKMPLTGVTDREALLKLLDGWPSTKKELANFSPDTRHTYRIEVVEKSPSWEILTFSEANSDGTLDVILTKLLEGNYEKVRESHPETFKDLKGEWKPFVAARVKLAAIHYADLMEAIRKDYIKAHPKEVAPESMIGDFASSYRMTPYVRKVLTLTKSDPKFEKRYVRGEDEESDGEKLSSRKPLNHQWMLVKGEYSADRTTPSLPIDIDAALTLKPNQFSTVYTRQNGSNAFFKFQKATEGGGNEALYKNVYGVQRMIGSEASKSLTEELLQSFQEKGAISLEFLRKPA